MRRHLITCFETMKMERFPILKERRIPFGSAVVYSHQEDIFRYCRMPYDKAIDMIQCEFSALWFHNKYVAIDNVNDYQDKNWLCENCQPLFGEQKQ